METIRVAAVYPATLWPWEEKGVEEGRPGHAKSLFLKLMNDNSYSKSSLKVNILILDWKF